MQCTAPQQQHKYKHSSTNLHFTINNPLILPPPIQMMHLRHKPLPRQRWKQHMIRKYRHQIHHTLRPRRGQRIGSMIGGGPCVRSVGHAAVSELIEDALVGMGAGAEEDEVFECVWEAVVGLMPLAVGGSCCCITAAASGLGG